MDLIQIIITIAFVGLVVWAIVTLVPMPEPFKRAIYVVSVLGLCVYVLSHFGLMRLEMK